MANPSGASSSSSSTVKVCFSDCDAGTHHDVNITPDMVVRDLKMLCAVLKSPPFRTDSFHLEKDGVQIIDLEATLESCNISAGDLLIMRFRAKTRGKGKKKQSKLQHHYVWERMMVLMMKRMMMMMMRMMTMRWSVAILAQAILAQPMSAKAKSCMCGHVRLVEGICGHKIGQRPGRWQ